MTILISSAFLLGFVFFVFLAGERQLSIVQTNSACSEAERETQPVACLGVDAA